MKTKVGKAVLKNNTARMDALNEDMRDLAHRLNKLKSTEDCEVEEILEEVSENRHEYDELQSQINKVIDLEVWLG